MYFWFQDRHPNPQSPTHHHLSPLLKITQLVCQLIWCVLAMMHGVTTAQTCSTNVSADVACHDGWSDNGVSADSAWFFICSGLLNWRVSWWGVYMPWCLVWYLLKIAQLMCQLMWRLLAMMPGLTAVQDYSTGVTMTRAHDYSTGVTTAWDY